MRKFTFFLFLGFLASQFAFAQLLKPASWVFKPAKAEVKVGEMVELQFTASIQKGWYLYSNDFDENLGPILTTVEFEPNDSYALVGGLTPLHPKKKYDEIWEGEVSIFKEKGEFVQKVKILKADPVIKGAIDFQTCQEDGQCINGNEKFVFVVKTNGVALLQPETPTVEKEKVAAEDLTAETPNIDEGEAQLIADEKGDLDQAVADAVGIPEEKEAETSLWQFLLLALGAGFASIFMPCIYPIMPMTVSFFTKQSNGRSKAFFYGLSIMLIFGLMGLVAMAFGAPFLNFISTHWLPNLIFFIIFILFGISLLGGFEIVLPHGAVNKIDRLSEKGGLVGIFFMALTLVVVSFSCTVPFVGSLLILSAEGEVWRPLYGMLAFGLPFALVFTALAMFPQWLKNLPKSGGWLNEIKAVFGFAEFALALKFLSNIDLAYHWNLIHRNIFILVWVLIAVIITLYIVGLIRLPKDKPVEKYSISRIGFAMLFLAFSLYMIPGVANKPLPALSGILPPMQYAEANGKTTQPVAENMRSLEHGLLGYREYEDALLAAKTAGKPVLIDFTGYACANCRKMEERVWPDSEVLKRMENDFVIASLYVDDKEKLPEEKHYVSAYDQELKTTVGDKNMDLEITKFNNNAQPYYVIVDGDGELLVDPIGYSSVDEFIDFLDRGKAKFN
ncbi:thioredoxin family protein [Marinilongibacter aquaticus]|uniref:protein-disulfide reductase DsbD family protein n=1 Tax=Marinilongibacter aquaticus TaxID=2975157 RepID=UPI0021BD2368|nr:protein-disulfide reductase DsbD domain-containing protein [Marinilongibacter aquaticus]UBM60712.1 thioredoxin family protein [Marinilongibacter aquaticus]